MYRAIDRCSLWNARTLAQSRGALHIVQSTRAAEAAENPSGIALARIETVETPTQR